MTTRKLVGVLIDFALLLAGSLFAGSRVARAQATPGCSAQALTLAQQQLTDTIAYTSTSQFPNETTPTNGNKWNLVDASQWTSGFFPGWIWFIYEDTLDNTWLTRAQAQTASMQAQDTNASTHDIGFKMLGSYGNEYRITRDPAALKIILTAANAMTSLYSPTAGLINSWPFYDSQHLNVIVDNMMNLELLFFGAANGGDPNWYNMAVSHALKTMQNHVRPDGSTFHLVQYNLDGTVYDKLTVQGAGTNTTWSRGQAWAIYGFTMTYRYTKDPRFLTTAQQTADYFINNLPSDDVPYWDFSQSGTAPRDSSAAAIAAAGLLELATYVSDADQIRYRTAALNIQGSLSSPAYLGVRGQTSGILLHGSANVPAGDYDKSLIYGDYYFIQGCYRAMTVPAAPTNLVASADASNAIHLSWDAEPGAIRYTVKRSTISGGPYMTIAPPPVLTAPNYSDSSVVAGSANYYYVVSATNVAGESSDSAEVLVSANNPVPMISSISPTNVAAGASFTLAVNGTSFTAGSTVDLGGKPEPTTFLSSTRLTAAVPASDVAGGATVAITVTNAPPGGGASASIGLTVNDFALSAPTTASVNSGSSVAVPLTITPSDANGFAGAVTFSISGLPSNVSANFSPASITPGLAQASSTLTFTAAAHSQLLRRTPLAPRLLRFSPAPAIIGLVLMLTLFLTATTRPPARRKTYPQACAAGMAAALLVIALASGCGGSGTSGTINSNPSTPSAQSSSVTITAQSGSDIKTTSLTLTVQ